MSTVAEALWNTSFTMKAFRRGGNDGMKPWGSFLVVRKNTLLTVPEYFCTELWVTSGIPHNQHTSNSFDSGEGHKKLLLTCKVLNFIKQSFQIFLKFFGAF